jgi:hypothetical protein
MLTRLARAFLGLSCISLVFAIIAWCITYSPSYQKCIGNHANYDGGNESSDFNQAVTSGSRAGIIPVFLLCEGAFIDENNGTITAIATFSIAVFTWTLWRATKRLWESSDKQIGIAQEAATAALRQANAVVALESPIPLIEEIKLVQYANNQTINPIADPLYAGNIPDFCRALVRITNIGRSPMRVNDFAIQWLVSQHLPDAPTYENVQPWGIWLTERSTQWLRFDPNCEITLSAQQRAQITTEEMYLWVYGRVRYANFMKDRSKIGFAARWRIASGFERDRTPAYHYERQENADRI